MAVTATANTYNSPVSFFISQNPPDNLSTQPAPVQQAFAELYSAVQQLIQALVNNCGIGPQSSALWPQLNNSVSTLLSGNLRRFYTTAVENIAFGAMVSLVNVGGVLFARNANATNNTKPMDGFCTTPGGILAAAVGEVTLSTGVLLTNGGLTPGTRFFLSTVNGLLTSIVPVASGNIEQYIGVAIDTQFIYINAQYWVQH